MQPRSRHVRRLHTTAEIEADTDRCIVCGAVARGTYSLDFAAGASTLDMSAPLPDAPLCAECLAAQRAAMTEGNRSIIVSLFLPPALVVLATLLAPVGTPVVLLVLAVAALFAMRIFIGWIARRRAARSRILFLDGAGEDVLLQLRLDAGVAEPATGYRDLARERPVGLEDDEDATPRGPKVRVTTGLVLSTLATAFATLVGWFGAYPLVVFDNPTGEATTVKIDGVRRLALPPGGKAILTLAYGTHRVALESGTERSFDLDVRFGRNMLVSQDETQCYHVSWRGVGRAVGYDQTVIGPRVMIDDPRDVTRATCPRSYVW